MRLRVSQRTGPVAGGLERLHVPQRDPRVVGIIAGQTRPTLGSTYRIATLHFPLRELLQRLAVPARQSRPLPVHPTLELVSIGEMEAVEEGAVVHVDRGLEVITSEG